MKKYLAEFIGTFCLLFCGTGAIVIHELNPGTIGHLGIALSFGLIVMIMIYAIGEISGSNINPAVSFVFYLDKGLSLKDLIAYNASQTLGAILASISLKCLFPTSLNLGATLPSGSEMQSFCMELFLAFLLMFVIDRVKDHKHIAGILLGSVITLEALFAGPISGASMNPVRSLAPAIVSGDFQSIWIYLLAPYLGMWVGYKASRYLSA